jgi:voltage-gated potassium channel
MKVPRIRRRWVLPVLLLGVTAGAVGAGAAAAFEADTVGSYWEGLWWSLSLMTTVGFLDSPPKSPEGAVASAVLMIVGFLMLSLVSATMASLLVREDEEPFERRELSHADEVLAALADISSRLHALEVGRQSHGHDPGTPLWHGRCTAADPPSGSH